MKLTLKMNLGLGLAFLLVGGILFTIAFAASGFSFNKMTGTKYENRSYTETGLISAVSIDVGNSEVTLKYDKNAEKISVDYSECIKSNGKVASSFSVTEANGKLTITENTRWIYCLQLWSTKNTKIVITVPEGRELSLDVDTDNGDVKVYGDAKFQSLNIETHNGDIDLDGNFTANDVNIETNNGDIEIQKSLTANTLTAELDNGTFEVDGALTVKTLTVELDNGDIEAEDGLITAQEIYFTTDNGDIEANLFGKVTDYKITVHTDNGKANVQNSLTGERTLYIKTHNGDAEITFANK